ncbi:hypothetical protein yberc0001_39170 [Yersinia bercovieri ATCC 43970]|uniref:Uncharacterized protein n=1 Tax=Yersinia bercovieri ATCC 43970 TaxID=349968 RepID=A0ABM9XUJ0_YERBE|nr:hypothetical protein yberc0001_39170 [Yersinia bercovieri ATCC 43970]
MIPIRSNAKSAGDILGDLAKKYYRLNVIALFYLADSRHHGEFGHFSLREWWIYLPVVHLAICRADSLKNSNLLAYAPIVRCAATNGTYYG